MNYVKFMRQVDGRKEHDGTTYCPPETAGTLDYDSIVRLAYSYGYSISDMESGPTVSREAVECFNAGYYDTDRPEVGLHSILANNFYHTGREHYQQCERDSQSVQQDWVLRYLEGGYGRSDGDAASSYSTSHEAYIRAVERFNAAMGSTSSTTRSGEEPTSGHARRPMYGFNTDEQTGRPVLRSAFDTEEGRVSGVRDERSGGELSEEDPF